ncbi:MAG TPA: circadian clock protein KaiC [Polyangiaceae bacterium]|nr:circadian clock protein KaiC [Polyangiaceae bacterium]
MALAHLVGPVAVKKTPSGIAGFDQITEGGLPLGRPTLVCGGPGSGKTIFAVEFLVRGAELGEPGVFVSFEESAEDLASNVAALGFDLARLVEQKLLAVDYVHLDRAEIEEAGGYSLDGLFVRLEHAIDAIGAKRVAIDTLEVLFGTLKDDAVVRAETQRLFRFLKERGVTVVVTAEAGADSLTRQGLEEYVSDCVVSLSQKVLDQSATRYLRIVKYRGSNHGTNEYPFLIDCGFSVVPASSLQLDYQVSIDRVSSGIPSLDAMLSGNGFYRTSTILVSGSAGCGKSILAAHLANATCARGERCMLFAFEESPSQIVRNMRSVRLDLQSWQDKGLLQLRATRPSLYGLEMHLVSMHKAISEFKPNTVILDPISSFMSAGTPHQIKAMLVRLFDWLKTQQITGLVTCLTTPQTREETDVGISSLIDTWIEVRDLEVAGERNRALYLLKSRGMSHSNQVRELVISNAGVSLADVFTGDDGVLVGSAKSTELRRRAREEQERAADAARSERLLELKRETLESQIATLRAEYALHEEEVQRRLRGSRDIAEAARADRDSVAQLRTESGSRANSAGNLGTNHGDRGVT